MATKNKTFDQKAEKEYIDLLYMTPSEVTAKDIAKIYRDLMNIKVELWEEMNVLELELSSKNSIEFEPLEPSFKDPSDAAFIKNRDIKSIFAINLCEEDLKAVIPYFEQLVEKYSGFICTDSADFMPIYAGSANRGAYGQSDE